MSVSDEMFFPTLVLKVIIQSLTAIDARSTMTTAGPKSVCWGWMIFSTDVAMRSIPMAATSTDTVSPARYSKRPWP